MGKYFGTDGFRGEANVELTAEHAFKIGRFLGWYYGNTLSGNTDGHKAGVVIGKDTRRSSYMFEYAIAAGLCASGANAYILHVTTTPSVSYVTRNDGFDCGVMISASHNAFNDNGIKLVNGRGEKMDDDTIELIEAYIDGDMSRLGIGMSELPAATGESIGKIVDYVAGRNRYIGYLISVAANSYRDFKIGLDCANGSSWMIAKAVFEALGAKTYVMGAEPDGTNINRNVGSTHIEALAEFVKAKGLDVGFAYDGDADRCLAVDENGEIVTGDHILYIFGKRLAARGELSGNTVVTTVMSNIGLYKALDEAGIDYVKTQVGDKYVYENMLENNYSVGGEQSGHIILKKYATTGDGILTSINIMEEMIDKKLPLSKLKAAVTIYPQVLKNVRVKNKRAVLQDEVVSSELSRISSSLEDKGRIILRESGTEPVIRVMVEGANEDECEAVASGMVELIKSRGLAEQ